MLTEQRFDIILKTSGRKKSVTVTGAERTSGRIRVHSAQETLLHWTKQENLEFSVVQ